MTAATARSKTGVARGVFPFDAMTHARDGGTDGPGAYARVGRIRQGARYDDVTTSGAAWYTV